MRFMISLIICNLSALGIVWALFGLAGIRKEEKRKEETDKNKPSNGDGQ